jgi:hypothetical protein
LAALYELKHSSNFVLNLIPFADPSNLLIASNTALLLDADPFTIDFIIAFSSASAKFIHYLVMFFLSGFIGEKSRKRLDIAGLKIERWAFLALFVVASTPLPDEPVVIPLGLLKYRPKVLSLLFFG